MVSKKSRLVVAMTSFWFFSIALIFVSLVIAVALYSFKFRGGLSDNSTDWSNFGSYMGGIFGPLVSFVTLLAVLKTVYLQRELLDAQGEEFNRMNILQQQTFEATLNQMANAASDARKLQVSAAQDTAIKVIDQHVSGYERNWDRHNEAAYRFNSSERSRAVAEDDEDFLQSILLHRDYTRQAIDQLVDLSIFISVTDFRTVHDVKTQLALGLARITNDFKDRNRLTGQFSQGD